MTAPSQQHSLFGEILDWMLAPLLLLWPMSIFLTYLVAQNIANRPYDRELGVVVRAIAQQASVDPASGSQPPWAILGMLAARKPRSMRANPAHMARAAGQDQCRSTGEKQYGFAVI